MRFLHYIKTVPGWITIIEEHYGKDAAERAEQWHDRYLDVMRITERYRYDVDIPKMRQSISAWREEMKDFERECQDRKRKEDEERLKTSKAWLEHAVTIPGDIEKKKRVLSEVKRLERLLRSDITQDDIDRAANFPVTDLLDIGPNRRAKCPFHHGEDYNADVRKNFVYCYVCNQHGNSIDVYRAIHGVGFKQAVKALS